MLVALVVVAIFNVLGSAHYVRTPQGLVWNTCMRQVPSGTHIITTAEQTVAIFPDESVHVIPKCPKKTIPNAPKTKKSTIAQRDSPDDGWQVWTAFNNNDNVTFDSFLGKFSVPQSPQNWDGGILYMFTGLQNDNWVPVNGEFPTPPGFDIIQPVLQYGGDSENGGGDYWGLASWYVTLDSGALWSDLITLNDGDIIFGNMTRTAPSTWFIGGTADGQTTSISVTYDRLKNQAWAYCTLEVYEIDDCNNFPPTGSAMKFTELALYDQGGKNEVTADWQALNNNGDHCSAAVTIISPTQVTIQF